MNDDFFFNDTFDNISFFVSTNSSRSCDRNVFSANDNNTVQNNSHISANIVKDVQQIVLDDSQFFNESFNIDKQSQVIDNVKTNGESNKQNTDSDIASLLSELLDETNSILVNDGYLNHFNNDENCDKKLSIHQFVADEKDNVTRSTQLSDWGLPEVILEKYKSHNVINMFDWQVQCLGNRSVLEDRKNLVYSAPTSAGKTLVAEILAIKTILECKKKVIFVLPFVSVVREKMFYFQDILCTSGIRVEGFMGSYNPPGGFGSVHVAICTIEKANSLINRLLEEKRLGEIGAVIIDEMHLLGDSSRGYQLELLLTKLRYMTIKDESVNIQIIGMSATLPNLNLLAKWLEAELYVTTYRPVPLIEQFQINNEIYDANLTVKRKLNKMEELEIDSDHILQLCLETILNSCSVLIFCPTKNWCESLSQQIAMAFWKLLNSKTSLSDELLKQLNGDSILEVLQQLRSCPVGLDKHLECVVSFGVSYHHAGLTMDERDIIEGAFKRNVIRVLVATSTLSSGVNLPARRVIVRTPIFHGKPIDPLIYRQMIGRAGRMGRDNCGESILVCQKNEYDIAKLLMSAKLPPIQSCLEGSGRLKRALLEIVASEVASTPADISLFAKSTLLAADGDLSNPVNDTINFLIENEFVRLQKLDDGTFKYFATPLGKACLSASMTPEEGLVLFAELQKARQCFVLDTELHIIYLVTPYSVCNQWPTIDWIMYLNLWEKLSPSMKRVGELIGVSEYYLVSQARGKASNSNHKLQIHKRFYTALALQDLVNEIPLNEVAKNFNCNRGLLQSLQQSASSFAGMVTTFSRTLGWSTVEILVAQFQERLQFGVSRDLLDLMKLPILDGPRARALFNNGIENLIGLASSDPYVLENILYKTIPFESERKQDGENEYDAMKRNKIRNIWIAGQQGLTVREAADMLIRYARRYLEYEMGVVGINWEQNPQTMSDIIDEKSYTKSSNEIDKRDCNNSVKERCKIDNSLTKSLKFINESFAISINEHSTPNEKCKAIYKTEHFQSETTNNLNTSSSNSLFDESDSYGNLEKNIFGEESLLKKNSSNSMNEIIKDSGFELNNCSADLFDNSDKYLKKSNRSLQYGVDLDSNIEFNTQTLQNKENVNTLNNLDNVDEGDSLFNIVVAIQNVDISANESVKISANNSDNIIKNSQSPTTSYSLKKRQRTSLSDDLESFIKTPKKKARKIKLQRKENISNLITDDGLFNTEQHTTTHKKSQIFDYENLEIVDVCANENLFKNFVSEIANVKVLSFSLACSKLEKNIIGQNVINKSNKIIPNNFSFKDRLLEGISFSWGQNVTYYVSMTENNDIHNFLKNLFAKEDLTIRIFDSKEQIKVVERCCDVSFKCTIEDPKVGDWLLHPDNVEKNFQAMVSLRCLFFFACIIFSSQEG